MGYPPAVVVNAPGYSPAVVIGYPLAVVVGAVKAGDICGVAGCGGPTACVAFAEAAGSGNKDICPGNGVAAGFKGLAMSAGAGPFFAARVLRGVGAGAGVATGAGVAAGVGAGVAAGAGAGPASNKDLCPVA